MKRTSTGEWRFFILDSEHQRVIVFANGSSLNEATARALIRSDDIIIAADGGALYSLSLGLTPAVVIGDFDSLDQATLDTLNAGGVRLVRYPTAKDETDLELALFYARDLGAAEVLIFSALGTTRWDMNIANVLLMAHPAWADMRLSMWEGSQVLHLVRPNHVLKIQGSPGDIVSLIPLVSDASGVVTHGLQYPLHEETLYVGATRGISNILIATQAEVKISGGVLLCIVNHTHK